MNIFWIYLLVILFGLCFGSFLNVVILRFDEIKTIWGVRSHCMKCKKEIRWYDLIPFFSYFALGAKCRYCKKPISYQYPIVEGITGLSFALIYWQYGVTWPALILAIVISILICLAVYDILHMEVPDILSYLGIIFSLGFVFVTLLASNSLTWESLIPYGYGVLAGGGFLGILVIISKGKWMGEGDILIGILMGILLGLINVAVALFLAFFIGSVIGLILIATKEKKMKDKVPFGPFLVAGTLIALFFGKILVSWYLGTF